MQIDGYVQALREDLARIAAVGDESTARAAELLAGALESALGRRLLEALGEAALLAGLPKSPSNFDPYRYAQADAKGHLVVPASAAPVVRRDWILRNLSTSRWTRLSQSQLDAALAEPVVLVGDQPLDDALLDRAHDAVDFALRGVGGHYDQHKTFKSIL